MGSPQSSPEPQGVSMRFLLVVVLLLVLGLCSVEGMRKRKRNRNQQQGRRGKQEAAGGGGSGEGGECTEDELECLRQVIPGEPKEDYPIYAPSFLCKLNPKKPGLPRIWQINNYLKN